MKQILVNTEYFRETAKHFEKHGLYTLAPEGSRDYNEFWDEEERRCLEGYKVGDLKITGRHYAYLNFGVIEKVPESALKDSNKISASVDKVLAPPGFWEIDLAWWDAKEEAMNRPYGEGNHLVCAKTRGCGWSYKEAFDGVYNYNFIPKSKSFYLAAIEDYLTKDGILNKVEVMLNHLNQKTDWYKNRHKHDTLMHRRASYEAIVDGKKVQRGYFSEIFGVIVDKADKARGKRGKKISFEEFGSFKNGKRAWAICRDSVEQGGFLAGQMSAFGTGGEEGDNIEALEDMVSNPLAYNCLAFENHWEDNEKDMGSYDTVGGSLAVPYVPPKEDMNKLSSDSYEGDLCGFVVPAYLANDKAMDSNGVTDIESSIELEMKNRVQIASSDDAKDLDKKVAERPFNLTELLQRVAFNPLPRIEALEQLKVLKRKKELLSIIRHGTLTKTADGFKFDPTASVRPLDYYPHKNDDKLEGCVTVYEMPDSIDGIVPGNIGDVYGAVLDPYYKDDAKSKTSLGALYVFKHGAQDSRERLVATYIARPNKLDDFYKNMFNVVQWYNATLQSEIAGGGKGVFDYAKTKGLLKYLRYEVTVDLPKDQAPSKTRTYFMNMANERKKQGLLYLSDWLLSVVGVREDGSNIHMIETIYDKGLLEEISKWGEDKNLDRVSSLLIYMYERKQIIEDFVDNHKKNKSTFFSRKLFVDKSNSSNSNGFL